MIARKYDVYVPLARIAAPSYRKDKQRPGETIYVVQAVDSRFFPQSWDTSGALLLDIAGDNVVGERPEGLNRKKDWSFAAYLKKQPDTGRLFLVGLDAFPSRPYKKSTLPSATKDQKELVISWKPSGLVEVTKRPPLVSGEEQAAILRVLNDDYASDGTAKRSKLLVAGAVIKTKRGRELGQIVSTTDSEIVVKPRVKSKSRTPVYTTEEE